MKRSRLSSYLGLILFLASIVALAGVSPVASTEAATETEIFHSRVVCAPGTHSSCLPGPYTETFSLNGGAFVQVDVFVEHTGHFETNEQSNFTSELGALLNCGPIPQGEAEVYCGQVSGRTGDLLSLTIEHSGGGSSTGSHRQRYEITVLVDRQFFPIILRQGSNPE